MATLLEQPKKIVERSTEEDRESSAIEREILALLRRPARYSPSLSDIRRELLPSYTELEIQRGLIHLLERQVLELVYVPGLEICFKLCDRGVAR